MGKGGKIFAKVLYYLVTFAFGVLLAITLPAYYSYYDEPLEDIQTNLESGNYDKAMSVVGGYYNKDWIYEQKFDDGGGIVIFEAATLNKETEEAEENTIIRKAYAGFIYDISAYDTVSNDSNQTKLLVYNDDTSKVYSLLDYDSDSDDNYDSIATFSSKTFIYFDLDINTYEKITKLEFIDKNGSIFKSLVINLDFSGQFFIDVSEFIEEYNKNYQSDNLSTLDSEFRSKSSNYCISSATDYSDEATKKSTIIVIFYFVGVYLVADLLLGKRRIIALFKLILVKVFKVKFKERKKLSKEEGFGHDYYSQVTFVLDKKDANDYFKPIIIRYDNLGEQVEFVLLKENEYKETKRIKAGNYPNLYIDIDSMYKLEGVPETLVVEGFRVEVPIKIIKIERNEKI